METAQEDHDRTDIRDATARRRVVRAAVALGALAAVLLGGVVLLAGWLSSKSEERSELPEQVELVFPGVGDGMLRQDKVGVDVEATYYCSLQIDEVVIPDDQLEGSVETGECYYRPGEPEPGEDKVIDEFLPGPHTAKAEIFNLADPEDRTVFTWDFEVL